MQKNGFLFKKKTVKKINNKDYSYLETANKIPLISYYVTDYNGKTYSIEYLNNINEDSIELEIQAKVVDK